MKRAAMLSFVLVIVIVGVMGVPLAVAQQPVPPATPDASIIVIPPPTGPVDDILNNPAVLTPNPTATFNPQVPLGTLQIGDTAIVIDEPLNVRTLPDAQDGAVILQMRRGEDVTVLGFNDNLSWALIDTRGPAFTRGWVKSEFLRRQGDFEPFEATSIPPTWVVPTGFVLRAQETVNIRSGPIIFTPRVGILAAGEEALIIGRKSTNEWWKIQTANGTVGWVSAIYVYVPAPEAYSQVPLAVD